MPQQDGAELIRSVGHPKIRLLYDAYHMQIMEGNIISTIRELKDAFGYLYCGCARKMPAGHWGT